MNDTISVHLKDAVYLFGSTTAAFPPLTLALASHKLLWVTKIWLPSSHLELHHSNIPGCTTAISPIPWQARGSLRIIQNNLGLAPPSQGETHCSFCATSDLTFDMSRLKRDHIVWMRASVRRLGPSSRPTQR